MAKLRSVNTHFWIDGFVVDLEPIEKLLFLYLITNQFVTLAGCYEIAVRQITFDTGLDAATVKAILGKLESKGKLVYRDGWIVLTNFLKNQSLNGNMKKNVEAEVLKAPSWARSIVVNAIASSESLRKDFESFESLRKGNRSEGELEKEGENEQNASAFQISPELQAFTETVIDGIKTELEVNQLPKETEWLEACEFAFQNNFSADHCLETFRLMRQQDWRTGRITAENFTTNLPELKRIRREIEKQKNGSRPFDPGAVQQIVEIHCDRCGDVGTITRFKKGSDSLKDATRIPCPDCSKEAIAA